MFTSIKLKNYKSLVDLEVSFLKNKKKVKKAVIIYGENGSGKSNFASAFYTLNESMQTLSIRKIIKDFLEKEDEHDGTYLNKMKFFKMISNGFKDTESIIKNYKTINSKENMRMEFNFILDDSKAGTYILEYNDKQIVHERLEYVLNKNKGLFYDISDGNININKKIFLNDEYEQEIKDLLDKYKGKHSFLSVIYNEREEKANDYIKERIHPRLLEVFNFFNRLSVRVKNGNRGEFGKIGLSHTILKELDEGKIHASDEDVLNNTQELLNEFFTKTYSDIKQVYYQKTRKDDAIEYKLFFKKKIYNKIIDIEYTMESTGTQHLLDILPFLLMSVKGNVVVIDELDTGIHDLLVENILNNVINSINGQLIVTTHNTMLLDSENINPEYIYTIMVDQNANKEMHSIVDFEDRTHPNISYKNRYIHGVYGGAPVLGSIDFDELNDIIK